MSNVIGNKLHAHVYIISLKHHGEKIDFLGIEGARGSSCVLAITDADAAVAWIKYINRLNVYPHPIAACMYRAQPTASVTAKITLHRKSVSLQKLLLSNPHCHLML